MRRSLLIFTLLILLAAAAYAEGKHDAIQSYIDSHHPTAKHIKMFNSSEGITMVSFTDHDMSYKIGFDQNDKPCCSEVQINTSNLPLAVKANIPAGVKTEYISYNATAKKHFYAVEYLQGTQKIKRYFNEDGSEIH